METTALLAALAIVSACVGSLVWVIKHLFSSILPVLNSLVVSVETNTRATQSADSYLRERNGRDNTFHNEIMDSLLALREQTAATDIVVLEEIKKVVSNTSKQSIAEQVVEHQVVNSTSLSEY